MQAADGGMRVPGALGVVFREDVVQPFRVIGQVLQIDGAIFDERDRFAVPLHRHHDIKSGLAHLRDIGLEPGIDRAHDMRRAQIAHQLFQLVQLRQQRAILMAVELDDQQRVRLPDQHPVDGLAVNGNTAAEVDHRAIDQLHRFRIQADDMAGGLHRLAEGGELADRQHLARLHRVQRQFQRGGEGQRPLRPHQQPGQIGAPGFSRGGRQGVDIVAADTAQLFREAGGDFLGLGGAKGAQGLEQSRDVGGDFRAEIVGNGTECVAGPIGQDGVDSAHIIRHQPVADGFRTAGVVPRHAANRAAGMR